MLFVALVHGLLLANDGVFDGWIIYHMLVGGDWDSLHLLFTEIGLPHVAYVHWAMRLFPDVVFGYRLVVFLSILGSAVIVYDLIARSRMLGGGEAALVAAAFASFPGYQSTVALSTMPYSLLYFVFFIGAWIAIAGFGFAKRTLGIARVGVGVSRVVSLALLYFSFAMQSLLVFHFAFLAFWWLLESRQRDGRPDPDVPRTEPFLLRKLDYILLPFLFFGIRMAYFAPSGLGTNYNKVTFDVVSWLSAAGIFVLVTMYQILESIAALNANALSLVVGAILVYGAYRGFGRAVECDAGGGARASTSGLLAFGVAVFVAAITPYAVVGKYPSPTGWSTRHAILVGLPVGILLVGVARVVGERFGERTHRVAKVAVGLVCLGFALKMIAVYGNYQVRWIKDRSVMLQLAEKGEGGGYSTYFVDDRFDAGAVPYEESDFAGMFKEVWHDETRLGVLRGQDAVPMRGDAYKRIFLQSAYDANGKQARMTILPGRVEAPVRALKRYYFYRVTGNQTRMRRLLEDFVVVQVRPRVD